MKKLEDSCDQSSGFDLPKFCNERDRLYVKSSSLASFGACTNLLAGIVFGYLGFQRDENLFYTASACMFISSGLSFYNSNKMRRNSE